MSLINLKNKIFILPASDTPLSADVILIRTEDRTWIFDTGSNDEALNIINAVTSPKSIVISHFHQDHAANLGRITLSPDDRVYVGSFTAKKYTSLHAVPVLDPIGFSDGITVLPLPSTHAKGCLLLTYEDYAFVGDGMYQAMVEGKHVYNTSLLAQTIRTVEGLTCSQIYLSHKGPEFRSKDMVVNTLKEIYRHRKTSEAYIEYNISL